MTADLTPAQLEEIRERNERALAGLWPDAPIVPDELAALLSHIASQAATIAALTALLDSVSHMVSPESEIGQFIRRERGNAA